MGDQVTVSFEGLGDYARLSGDQKGYLKQVEGLVNGSCANFGAFTGFLAFFAGTYETAHGTVSEELARSRRAAHDLRAAFRDTLRDYRTTDEEITRTMVDVRKKVDEATPFQLPDDPSGPGMPRPLKYGASGVGTGEAISDELGDPGRRAPDVDVRGTPADGLSLTSDVMDTISAGQSIEDAKDDEQDYEDFEDERAGGDR